MSRVRGVVARKFEHDQQEYVAVAVFGVDGWAIMVLHVNHANGARETGHRAYLPDRVSLEDVGRELGGIQKRVEDGGEPDELPGGGA